MTAKVVRMKRSKSFGALTEISARHNSLLMMLGAIVKRYQAEHDEPLVLTVDEIEECDPQKLSIIDGGNQTKVSWG